MPVGLWSGDGDSGEWDVWDEPRVVSRDVSSEAFMEELCTAMGGYRRFLRSLMCHHMCWWVTVVGVLAIFVDHHRCAARLPYFAWLLYAVTLSAMLVLSVLLELSLVQRLGLLKAGEVGGICRETRWRLPLIYTILWKLDAYTDFVFIFVARDCGSSLWWVSAMTFAIVVVFGQLLFNTCFACTDCGHKLPPSFGFVLLDFKLVNSAVRHVLPFDPDTSHARQRSVTLRASSQLVSVGKCAGDVAQVWTQVLFIRTSAVPHGFVVFSALVGGLHCFFSVCLVLLDCVQDEWAVQVRAHTFQHGVALLPGVQLASTPTTFLTSPENTPPQSGRMPETGSRPRGGAAAGCVVELGTCGKYPERGGSGGGRWAREIPDLL